MLTLMAGTNDREEEANLCSFIIGFYLVGAMYQVHFARLW